MNGAASDMPWVMSKMFHLGKEIRKLKKTKLFTCPPGMPLSDIIKAVTVTPAKAIGYGETIGVLEVGREADITLLEVVVEVVEDAMGNIRTVMKIIQPRGVWRYEIRKNMV